MTVSRNICAVVPLKETQLSKQRLAAVLAPARRQRLALAMFEDVLAALSQVSELAAILVVTIDEAALGIANRYGVRILSDGARAGHSGGVGRAAKHLAAEDLAMLTLPADVPLVEPEDIRQIISAHASVESMNGCGFTIVPARDERGSNAVLCSPADAIPLRFGEDSFFPHLSVCKERGMEPCVLRLPRIALDIDTPEDLMLLLERGPHTRAGALLDQWRWPIKNRTKATA
jgi:2-phospho-L-lactate/phosphoenolpyruvate guanylyltransferase